MVTKNKKQSKRDRIAYLEAELRLVKVTLEIHLERLNQIIGTDEYENHISVQPFKK